MDLNQNIVKHIHLSLTLGKNMNGVCGPISVDLATVSLSKYPLELFKGHQNYKMSISNNRNGN